MITVKEFIEITDTSLRLRNVLDVDRYYDRDSGMAKRDLNNKPIDLVQPNDILSIRNAGIVTWNEFEELRDKYITDIILKNEKK
jgi:hypothetical protein